MTFKPNSIPTPQKNLDSLHDAIMALKTSVDVLTKQSGPKANSAVTWQDLVDLKFIQKALIPK